MASTHSSITEKKSEEQNDTATLAPAPTDQLPTVGKADRATDEHHIPHNNLFLVFCALTLTVFLVKCFACTLSLEVTVDPVTCQAALDSTMYAH